MQPVNLCDFSDLVSGWHHPPNQAWDYDQATESPTTPVELSDEAALQAVDVVSRRWPQAAWKNDGEFGRITNGPDCLSLKFPLRDPEAEQRAWIDAACRVQGHGTGM